MTSRLRLVVRGSRGSIPVSGAPYHRYGGATSCFEVVGAGPGIFIDAGTGIAAAGADCPGECHIFLTHYHLDHIQGLTGFAPLFDESAHIRFYGPEDVVGPEEALAGILRPPWFPVSLEEAAAKKRFTVANDPVTVGGVDITPFPLHHPDGCRGYRIDGPRRSIAIATDYEHADDDHRERVVAAVAGCDVLVHDAQFTPEEEPSHEGWGHSTWDEAVATAEAAGVARLVLTSHAPERSDDQVDVIVGLARRHFPFVDGAYPGMELDL